MKSNICDLICEMEPLLNKNLIISIDKTSDVFNI